MKKHGAVATIVVVGGVVGVVWMIRKYERKPRPQTTYPGGAYKIRNMGPERALRRIPGLGNDQVPPDVRKINDGAFAPAYPLTRAFSAPGF